MNEIAEQVLKAVENSQQESSKVFMEKCQKQDISVEGNPAITKEQLDQFYKIATLVKDVLSRSVLYRMSFLTLTGMQNSPTITDMLIRGIGLPLVKQKSR